MSKEVINEIYAINLRLDKCQSDIEDLLVRFQQLDELMEREGILTTKNDEKEISND